MNVVNPKNPIHTINPVPALILSKGSDNILIVRPDRLGDVLLTLPMARAIKKALPDAHVSFLIREYTKPIVDGCPDVDEVIIPSSMRIRDLIPAFRQSKANVAFFPVARFPLALAAWLARIPVRVGTGYRWYSFLFSHIIYEHRKFAEHHEAEYNLRMLSVLSINPNMDELANITLRKNDIAKTDKWLQSNISKDRFAVLHISSGGSTIQFPLDKFVEIGKELQGRYSMQIVLTGLDSEKNLLDKAANSIGTETTLFIGHQLEELAALLTRASVVISIGTGPGHLAATMGAPTIGLFPLPLAISKERWGFRGLRAVNLSPQPIEGCPNCSTCTCMERLTTESVIQAVDEVLS